MWSVRALATVVLLVAPLACLPAFQDSRTPSGVPCPDLPIIAAGREPGRDYHRLLPIRSETSAGTEAERLESLRREACSAGADAVIEAVNEEVGDDSGDYALVASGTAVVWLNVPMPRSNSRSAGTKPAVRAPKAEE